MLRVVWPGITIAMLSCGSQPTGTGDVAASIGAQAAPTTRADEIVGLALEDGRAHDLLAALVKEAPHRLSGSPGAARAVAWARRAMLDIGLTNVRLDKVMVPRWVRGEDEEVALLDPGPERGLPALALGGSVGTPASGIVGDVLMVRTPRELEQPSDRARGKIVFFNRPMPRALRNTFQAYRAAVPQRTAGASQAARAGAIATLVRSMTTRIDDNPHTGAIRYADDAPRIPAAAISTRAAEHLAELLRSGCNVRVRMRLPCRSEAPVESANVIGEIRGSERPDEIVLIGGHLDCWDVGQGAHDDGAGVVHCLEAARLLLSAGLRPKRTVRVVLFMNEENGLAGARQYAKDHAADKHVAAIESDRGGFEPKGFTCSSRGDRLARYKEIVAALAPHDMGVLIRGGGGADVSVLGPKGVPLFGLLPSWHRYFDYHHSERDTIDTVHPRELQLGAAAVAYLAFALANE